MQLIYHISSVFSYLPFSAHMYVFEMLANCAEMLIIKSSMNFSFMSSVSIINSAYIGE